MPSGAGVPPPPDGSGGRSTTVIVLVALLAVALIGGVLAVVLVSGDDDGDESASPDEVFMLEPISSTGDNPFMEPVGDDEPDVEPPDDVGAIFTGDTEGLYGGTLDTASCDADQMVAFLEANPTEAQAWADVQGIAVDQIADYVDGLTPMVLRADTAVTNHGFTNGAANPIPAVLQAGTAVMVDDFGVPRVKCYCGNPLLPPPPRAATTVYRGPEWTGYRETNITIIQETTVEIDVFVVIDVETGEPFGRPAGTDGSEDGPAPGQEPPPTTTTEPPFDFVGNYEGTLSTTCGENVVTATADGSTVTLTGENDLASGPIAPDGSFSVSSTIGEVLTGTVTSDAVTGDYSYPPQGCTGSFSLPRTG